MKYTDLSINLGFHRNMRETNWLKLFPHWWSETDPLLTAIGQELEYIKAQSIFQLLNATVKPPVLLWQNAINNKQYIEEDNITSFPHICELPAPLYETQGKIFLKNKTIDNIYDLIVSFTDQINDENEIIPKDGIIIRDTIRLNDEIEIDVGTKEVFINDEKTDNIVFIGDGISYFKTSINQNKKNENNQYEYDPYIVLDDYDYNPDVPLHNEILRIKIDSTNQDMLDIQMDLNIQLDNAVFITEQNIEVTGLELIPIKKIELYAYYDFPYNSRVNGWRKVYDKEYDIDTNVIYDMITTQFFTWKFYTEVWFKGLDYPYKIGFPCYRDAPADSMYHTNNNLDYWGKLFGLPRRTYKKEIPKKDYPYTFPEFYPFDIEQDYWYYLRLISEYSWHENAINDVDLKDTEDNPIIRLHSINPFTQDFAIHAKSTYPIDKYHLYSNTFLPSYVSQENVVAKYKRVPYYDLQNLLTYDDNFAYVTLANKSGTLISSQKYLSQNLKVFFDTDDIPQDVSIENIEIIVEGKATDNSVDRYSNADTGIIINGLSSYLFPMEQTEDYELDSKKIVYSLKNSVDEIKKEFVKKITDSNIIQKAIIQPFIMPQATYIEIPFILEENDDIVDDITEVYVTYNDSKTYQGTYHIEERNNEMVRYIRVFAPIINKEYSTIKISCKSDTYNSFLGKDIIVKTSVKQVNKNDIIYDQPYISGPYIDEESNKRQEITINDEWHTSDLCNILHQDGITFVNVFENDNENGTPTIFIKNITLKIEYTPKKSSFILESYIKKNNIVPPELGKLHIDMQNTGDKPLNTQIDLAYANNLRLSEQYIAVDLGIGESLSKDISITPEYPLLDGTYEILAVCEDAISTNSIDIDSVGLIQTGIYVEDHYGVFGEELSLKAKITNAMNLGMDSDISVVDFYIDGYRVNTNAIIVENNMATFNIQIYDQNNEATSNASTVYLSAGIHRLEVRYKGTTKFAPSRSYANLIIARNVVTMHFIDFNEVGIYGQPYESKVELTYGGSLLVDKGFVTFYIDDTDVGTVKVNNGIAHIKTENLNFIPKKYTLTAVYNGTEKYGKTEISQSINIIGGETKVSVFDVDTMPYSDVILKARVNDMYNVGVKTGKCTFTLKDSNNEDVQIFVNNVVNVDNGVATLAYHVRSDVLKGLSDNTIVTYKIYVTYEDDDHIYQSSTGIGTLTIRKREVIIEYNNIFYGSQYEPLGFYVHIKDAETGEPVTNGKVKFSIPDQNIGVESGINEFPPVALDEDGGARAIFNPINFTAKEFQTLLNFYMKIGNDMPGNISNANVVIYEEDNQGNVISPQMIKVNEPNNGGDNWALRYKTISLTDELALSDLNGCIRNIQFKDGKLSWNLFNTSDTTPLKNVNDLSKLNGLLYHLDFDNKKGKLVYSEFHNRASLYHLYTDEDMAVLRNFEIVTNAYIDEYGHIQYETSPCGFKTPLSNFNGCIKNLRIENNELTYDIFETDDDTRIENLYDLSVLNGLLYKAQDDDAIVYREFFYRKYPQYQFNEADLYRIYDGKLSDLNLMDFELGTNEQGQITQLIYRNNVHDNEIAEELREHVYINPDGHLYARTNIDTLRKYTAGIFPVDINFQSSYQYKKQNKKGNLKLSKGAIDIDIQPYNITNSDFDDDIICYVTEYNFDEDDTTTTLIEGGKAHFYIDNVKVGESNVIDGIAQLPINTLNNITMDNHLLGVEYTPVDNQEPTYTYSIFKINPIPSTISGSFNRILSGKISELTATISVSDEYDVSLEGIVNLYMDDKLIASNYLTGLEALYGNANGDQQIIIPNTFNLSTRFQINIPDDLQTKSHIVKLEYLGNKYVSPSETIIPLHKQEVEIDIETHLKYVKRGGTFSTHYIVTGADDDDINEGVVQVRYGRDENNEPIIVAQGNVQHNHVYLKWQIPADAPLGTRTYAIWYKNGVNYIHNPNHSIQQKIKVIDGLNDLYIGHEDDHVDLPFDYDAPLFNNLNDALMCTNQNANIHILDYTNIDDETIIEQNINIIGVNNASIIKDLPNLLTEEIGTLKIYTNDDFTETLYPIQGMTEEHLNSTFFNIINSDLYFTGYDNLEPIYLFADGKFYANKIIPFSSIYGISKITISENCQVTIHNINFDSNDTKDYPDLIINSSGSLTITKSIINKNTQITSYNSPLTINSSIVYGHISPSDDYDLDNNWWGSNEPKYSPNNYIQLTMSALENPPVIGTDIIIDAELRSTNGIKYDLPPIDFRFEANTGDFSVSTGEFVDSHIRTIYTDCAEEDKIYCTVDNETVSLDILDYDRQIEIILEDNIEIPIGYQVPITAKVQSLADTYYKFNPETNDVKKTNNINEGYIIFKVKQSGNLTYKQIGRVKVVNGEATIPFFTTENKYPIIDDTALLQYALDIKVEYEPENYYFAAENENLIRLINETQACYVSTTGNINGDGTFFNPYNSIQQAINANKQRIYLKSGEYLDNNINIIGTQYIRKYDGQCIFKNNTQTIFYSNDENSSLTLNGLIFTQNESSYLIDNIDNLIIKYCTFVDNETNVLINNKTNTEITYSVLIHDPSHQRILENYSNTNLILYCWFGTGLISDESIRPYDKIEQNSSMKYSFNNYVVMQIKSSKPNLYLGSVAYITGDLSHYRHHESNNDTTILKLEKNLPLRIAKFNTDFGSVMPLKDYTYNNKATTFLNTKDVYILLKDAILTLPDNTNYINEPYTLKCYVQNIYGDNLTSGRVLFTIKKDTQKIQLWADVINGVATVNSLTPLEYGEYQLECEYRYDESKNVKINSTFSVVTQSIIIDECNIDETDHLYNMHINAKCINSIGDMIQRQDVNFYIDDILVGNGIIQDGILNTQIYYQLLTPGKHTLTIATDNYDTVYKKLKYNKEFISYKKDTYIEFNYSGLPANESIDLVMKVFDDNNRIVDSGEITLTCTHENNIQKDYVTLQHGVGVINFNKSEGMYLLLLEYSGNQYYNQCLLTKNNFNIGLDEVILDSEVLQAQLNVDLEQAYTLKFPIYNKYNQLVKHGFVNLYIDNVLQNSNPLRVDNTGYVSFNGQVQTNAGQHDFKIVYTDTSEDENYVRIYMDTILNTKINVRYIPIQIITDNLYLYNDGINNVNYEIQSTYGQIVKGKLDVLLDDIKIGSIEVNDYNNYIPIDIPLRTQNDNNILTFRYTDDTYNYESLEEKKYFILQKPQVLIKPIISSYYPNKNFDYVVYINNPNRALGNNTYKPITMGTLTLYIDNSKYMTKTVYDGVVTFLLNFEIVKDYNITLVYEENEYYDKTVYNQIFTINNIQIDNITIKPITQHIYPNSKYNAKLIFNTPITELGNDVTDGFIDFYIDGQKTNTYAVIEGTLDKYVVLDVPNINKGNYDIHIDYYGSKTYQNYSSDNNLITIEPIPIGINVMPLTVASLDDDINIVTSIDKSINGLLQYSLVSTKNGASLDYPFAIEQINYRNNIEILYTLPYNLDPQAQHKIKVELLENVQYTAEPILLDINIDKVDPEYQSHMPLYIEYLDTIAGYVETNIKSHNQVIFYIDGEDEQNKIANVPMDDNGIARLRYRAENRPDDDIDLYIVIPESSTFNRVSEVRHINVVKASPQLKETQYDNTNDYYYTDKIYNNGEKINLTHLIQIVNYRGEQISEGTLTYLDDNRQIISDPNNFILNYDNDEVIIYIQYDSNGSSLYKDTEFKYKIKMQKSNLLMTLDDYLPITRGELYENYIILKSSSSIKVNSILANTFTLYFKVNGQKVNGLTVHREIINKNNERCIHLYDVLMPTTLIETESYTLVVQFAGDQNFNATTKEFVIGNKNKDYITVNTSDDFRNAFNLISDGGIINLANDIEGGEINNNKNVIINGNNHTIYYSEITNNGKLTINNVHFDGNLTNNSIITTNNELYVNDCTFINGSANYGGAIFIDTQNQNTEINHCTFNSNSASLYGGAIFSNQGNDVTIQNSLFVDGNDATLKGSCIANSGNIHIFNNIFIDNSINSDIYIIAGSVLIDNNYFGNNVVHIENKNGNVEANLNYWNKNHSNVETINVSGDNITIDTWLVSDYEIEYQQKYNQDIKRIITPLINKYKNRLEQEDTIYEENIENIPITFKINNRNIAGTVNKSTEISGTGTITFKIGTETFSIED